MSYDPSKRTFIAAECPNCGGALQVPNNLDKVICMYCGKEFFLNQGSGPTGVVQIKFDTQRYLELMDTAYYEAKDYRGALKYADKMIEECPPDNTEALAKAWYYKGLCFGLLTTANQFHVKEMLAYVYKGGMTHQNAIRRDDLDVSYALAVANEKLLTDWEDIIRSQVDRVSTPQPLSAPKSMGEGIGTGIGMALAKNTEQNSLAKQMAKTFGQKFVAEYQTDILTGIDFAWELGKTEGIAKNLISLIGDTILTFALDPDTKKLFLIRLTPIITEIYHTFPGIKPLPEITKDKGCFIATAVMGDYDHPAVLILRQFRDKKLELTWFGRLFILAYYRFSPPVARIIETSRIMRLIGYRTIVWPVVRIAAFILDIKMR